MGEPKVALSWHGSSLLRRVAGIVARAAGPVVLVRSPGQALPALPSCFEVLEDLEEANGPLAGISVGLESLLGRCERAYVSSIDVPFLHPVFVRRVLDGLDDDHDACVPYVRGFRQPLAACYRPGLSHLAHDLVSSRRLRVSLLFESCRWKELDEAALLSDPDLAVLDPGLESVVNVNSPEEYRAALGRPEPLVQVSRLERHGPSTGYRQASPIALRTATLGGAADALEVDLDKAALVLLNGAEALPDPSEPLVEGDAVGFCEAAPKT
jgi:molybdopterin-guanine dinucleotide biosynthesis protein A